MIISKGFVLRALRALRGKILNVLNVKFMAMSI
jgi:hypothetical protein